MTYFFDQAPSGGKFDGLSRLPTSWAPPFFVISHEIHRRWLEQGADPKAKPADLLGLVERDWIETEVRRLGARPQSISLFVRSNAAEEGLDQRGLLRSVRCDGTVEAIISAALEVFKASSEAGVSVPIGLIVQIYCSPILSGHLSNERRVSEEARRWVCEIDSSTQLGKETGPRVMRWRVEAAVAIGDKELLCSDRKGLARLLRSVGKYFYEKRERRHLEWVWDGTRLWIVQNDPAPDPKGESVESGLVVSSQPIRSALLRQFRSFSSSDAKRWQKLKCVETFRSMKLPTTSLFVLKGADRIRRLAKEESLPGLLPDLRELTKAPLVIRTDIAGQVTLFAKRTDCVSKPEAAARFLRDTARDLLHSGVHPGEVCFIAHRFIPACASAFSMATAGGSRVTVDGSWGLPDGLEFCPHDSFEVDVRSGSIIARRIRYKPTFLAALPDDSWKATPVGAPWDWKPSIDDSTVRQIAALSKRLAEALNKTIVIMWFVGIPPGSAHPDLIPWRYTTEGELGQVEPVIGGFFLSKPFFVRNSHDVDRLGEKDDSVSSVILKPDGPHLRHKSFLERLGRIVKARGLRIDLEGSPLSHTYYVLKRTGAHVACIDPIAPRSVRRQFGKLVRDKIPVRIQTHGEKALTISLPKGELLDILKAKIVEEAMEVLSAPSPDTLREEMADVLEVLIALCRMGGSSLKKLEKLAAQKRRKVGGFGKGLVLVQTEEMPLLEVRSGDGLFNVGRIRQARDSYQAIVAAGRRLKTRHDRIIIPLIPSVPDRLRGPSRIYFRNPDLEFEVWYREKSVEVILVRQESDSSAQLELPFNATDRP
jgi:predicted house-cleaning noncanonical NTP pyrophosphatase (MazG superfamily)